MEISEKHPYWHVRDVIKNSNVAKLHFSYYRYRPQSLIDERMHFSLSRENFLNIQTFTKKISDCPPEFELAIHSTIIMSDGELQHIPMIDMSTSARAHIQRLSSYLGQDFFETFSWYESGRSFHGYGGKTLTQSAWVALMGTLLLANQKNLAPTVDPRWIGHRLIAGYSALRWTKNTQTYISIPRALTT